MKTIFIMIISLFVAYFAIAIVNEYCRSKIGNKGGLKYGYATMNSALATPDACTWSCYNNTSYCKQNHVKVLNNYFSLLDPLYFGMIKALKMTGNYGAANVAFLVILWPVLISFLFATSLLIQFKIRILKKRNG